MSYREIPEDRILKFLATPGFSGWKQFFTEDSITHPAKMNLNLLRHIIRTYTKAGDVILDPMAGTGSTIIIASIESRHGIAVEYEEHFCKMIRENIKLTEKQSSFKPRGKMFCIQGDARELSKLLGESDAIITSPPYEGSRAPRGRESTREQIESRLRKAGYSEEYIKRYFTEKPSDDKMKGLGMADTYEIDAIITSPPYGSDNANLRERKDKSAMSVLSTTGVRAVSLEEDNIGVLEYGDVDAIITSPPYEGSYLGGGDQEARKKRLTEAGYDAKGFFGGKTRDTILKHYDEVDTIVTSPPYADSVKRGDEGPIASGKDSPTYDERIEEPKVYSNDPKNIGNLRHGEIDNIVTSPPYEGAHQICDFETYTKIQEDARKGLNLGHGESEEYTKKRLMGLIKGKDNIGNLKSDSYLEAMLQCYREFYKVLKDSGKLILVTKNFIRDKQVVRLDEDTIKLCEASGFTLKDRWYFRLPQISFWRILYQKKFPDVSKILYEDVLIFEKGVE